MIFVYLFNDNFDDNLVFFYLLKIIERKWKREDNNISEYERENCL